MAQRYFSAVSSRWALGALTTAMVMASVAFTGCQLMPDSLKSMLGLSSQPVVDDATPLVEKQAAAQALFDKGIAAADAGQRDKAIEAFEQVLEIFPKHVAANTNLGLAYANQQQWAKAKHAFALVLNEEPDNPDANANLAWVLAEQHQWPQALERGLKAGRLSPENPYVFNTLGWVYAQTEQYDEAIGAYDKAIALNPALVDAQKAKGLLYCQLGKAEQAQATLAALPADTEAHTALATAIGQGCVAQ